MVEAALREMNDTPEWRGRATAVERDRAWRVSQELPAVVEADGTIAEVNAACAAPRRWRPRDRLGRWVAGFAHPDDPEATMGKFAAAIDAPLTVP